MKEQTVSFTTRLPKHLHRKAKKRAKEERRSLNKQIEILVEMWAREANQTATDLVSTPVKNFSLS